MPLTSEIGFLGERDLEQEFSPLGVRLGVDDDLGRDRLRLEDQRRRGGGIARSIRLKVGDTSLSAELPEKE